MFAFFGGGARVGWSGRQFLPTFKVQVSNVFDTFTPPKNGTGLGALTGIQITRFFASIFSCACTTALSEQLPYAVLTLNLKL